MDKTINRNYKDGLFRMIFSEKKELLSLYNAISGRNYQDPDLLEINTLEDAIYMGIKNDISFVLDGRLSMYEHQSTWNENLPLRNLFYISNIYSGFTESNDKNLYGSKMVKLPNPHFAVFYNGIAEKQDRTIMRLSEAYEVPEETANLELMVVVLNINKGHNEELMKECPLLGEYAYYVATVREYKKTMNIKEAVEMAIQHCIKNGVLAEFLRTHRAEVETVSLFQYDAERHIALEKAESREEGRTEGDFLRLIDLIIKKNQKSKPLDVIADELECALEEIQKFYDVVQSCGADCTAEMVLEEVALSPEHRESK